MAAYSRLTNAFQRGRPLLFGMVHVQALPGTPHSSVPLVNIVDYACREAEILVGAGMDGVIVENMHDVPYTRNCGAEIVAAMTRVCYSVRNSIAITGNNALFGLQILAGCNKEAIAVALASGIAMEMTLYSFQLPWAEVTKFKARLRSLDYDFIRAEGYVFAHVADEGWMESCAGDLLRYRKSISADHISVITDIKKKHSSHSVTADISLVETAKAAEFFCSDGVIITGSATGDPPQPQHVKTVQKHVKTPVIVGSGVSEENLEHFWNADALIVGSTFKKNADWKQSVCQERVASFMQEYRRLCDQNES